MMIDVLLFAELQEAFGKEKLTLDADFSTVKDLKTRLYTDYQLTDMDGTMTAVNEEYAADDAELADGDVVALIPPVSGG